MLLIVKLADQLNPELYLKEYHTLILFKPTKSLFPMQVLKPFLPHLLLQKLPDLLAADVKHVECLD